MKKVEVHASLCDDVDSLNLSEFKMNLMADSNKLQLCWKLNLSLRKVPLFYSQIDLNYSHQLIVIHEGGFSGYWCDNDSAEKNGKNNQPPNYRDIKDSHTL